MTSRLGGSLILLLSLAAPAAAATWPSEWKPFELQGLTVSAIAAAPDLLCAGTAGQGVYCRNLAASGSAGWWEPKGLGGSTLSWLWIDPVRPTIRYAAAGSQSPPAPSLYRTLDGGASWGAIDHFPAPGGRAWAVTGMPDAGPLWAAGGGVWISYNLGGSWVAGDAPVGLGCIAVAPTDPFEVWTGGETNIYLGITARSFNGGQTWDIVWDSSATGDNQTSYVAPHPSVAGLLITGHEGFVLRTEDHGGAWQTVLDAQVRFFLDWNAANPDMAWAAGSPNQGTALAYASRDLGRTWSNITGTALAPRTVFRVAADPRRNGVVYAATDDGVFRYYGGGMPVCLDAGAGTESILLAPGVCPPSAGEAAIDPSALATVTGDAIAFDLDQVRATPTQIDLGEVECLIAGGDISLMTLDTPDPAPGRALGILVRPAAETDYGTSSDGRPRRAGSGDCP